VRQVVATAVSVEPLAAVSAVASVVDLGVATAASEAMLAVVLAVATLVLGAPSVWGEAPLADPVAALASEAVLVSGLVAAAASQVGSVKASAVGLVAAEGM